MHSIFYLDFYVLVCCSRSSDNVRCPYLFRHSRDWKKKILPQLLVFRHIRHYKKYDKNGTRSKSTCLILPKSREGKNCTSHVCTGWLFSRVRHFCTERHFSMSSTFEQRRIYTKGTVLHSDTFARCYISTKVVLLHCYNFARRYFYTRFTLAQNSILHGNTFAQNFTFTRQKCLTPAVCMFIFFEIRTNS